MNALEMKLIAMKFALSRKAYVPNDTRFTSSSGAYDVGLIQQQLSQGTIIDDRDLIITNTIIEDCEHTTNTAPVSADVIETSTTSTTTIPPLATTTVAPEITTSSTTTEPPVQVIPDNQSFGGRIWQYFKDTTNVQPKP